MSLLPPRFDFGPMPADRSFGFASAVPSIAASQRASLGRGIAFVLLLAAVSLASVSVPRALQGPDWVAGTALGPPVAGR